MPRCLSAAQGFCMAAAKPMHRYPFCAAGSLQPRRQKYFRVPVSEVMVCGLVRSGRLKGMPAKCRTAVVGGQVETCPQLLMTEPEQRQRHFRSSCCHRLGTGCLSWCLCNRGLGLEDLHWGDISAMCEVLASLLSSRAANTENTETQLWVLRRWTWGTCAVETAGAFKFHNKALCNTSPAFSISSGLLCISPLTFSLSVFLSEAEQLRWGASGRWVLLHPHGSQGLWYLLLPGTAFLPVPNSVAMFSVHLSP